MDGGGGLGGSDGGGGEGPRWGVVISGDDGLTLGVTDDLSEGLLLVIEEVAGGGVGFNDDEDGGEQPDELYDDCGRVGR